MLGNLCCSAGFKPPSHAASIIAWCDITEYDFTCSGQTNTSALAQTTAHPDFSGTWKLNLAKSKPPNSKIKSEIITITTDGDQIQFHYSGEPKDRLHIFTPDGEEHPVGVWTETDPPSFVKTSWDKSTLVIEFFTRAPGGISGVIQRWNLSPDGKSLTMEVPTPKLSYVYDKQ